MKWCMVAAVAVSFLCGGMAFVALGQFVRQGGLEGVAGHRLGEDALDPAVTRNDLARGITDTGEHDQQDVVV